MNENKSLENKTIRVCLYEPNEEKHVGNLTEKEIFDNDNMEDIDIYKDSEEIYIATSPSFSTDVKSSIDHVCYNSDDENSTDLDDSKSAQDFSIDQKDYSNVRKDLTIEPGSLKSNSSSYPVVNSVDGQNYLVSSDFSQLNNLGVEVPKTFFYVLSPMGTVNALIRTPSDEGLDDPTSTIDISSTNEESLDSDEITPRLTKPEHNDMITDNEKCLSEFDQESECIDLTQSQITSDQRERVEEDFDHLNHDYHVNFINGISDRVNTQTKDDRQQLIWQSLPTSDRDQEKHGNQSTGFLMNYDHNTKMELPIINGQPYLQVALVNDMEPASTSELVSTDEILGVTVPEIFSCKWEGCGTHFLTVNDLVKHVNSQHINPNSDGRIRYTCFWKGCVRDGKQFDARYKMLIHLRTHTGEKPHFCPLEDCHAAFSRIENLKIHVRTHTGERPYPCQYEGCGKSFANSSDRFKHKRTHTEKKPYRCSIKGCEKSYTDPSSLRKHRKRHAIADAKKI